MQRRQGKELTKRQKWKEEREAQAGCGLQLVTQLLPFTLRKKKQGAQDSTEHILRGLTLHVKHSSVVPLFRLGCPHPSVLASW